MGNGAKALRTVGLVFMGSLLGAMAFTGRLELYLEPALSVNGGLAAAALVVLGFFQYIAFRDPARSGRKLHAGSGRPSASRHDWLSFLIFALPGVIALGTPPATLDARAAIDRGLGKPGLYTCRVDDFAPAGAPAPSGTTRGGKASAAEAELVGFVARTPDTPAGHFLAVRFTVSCCVADALPVALLVQWPDASGLAENTWVRVRGRVVAPGPNGEPAEIIGESVTVIPRPRRPYIYR